MTLLRKAVALEVGVQGVKAHPHTFRFAKNLDKILEIRGKNGAQCCLALKKWRPGFAEKHMKP